MRQIITPQTIFGGFSSPDAALRHYRIDDPDADFWSYWEKVLSQGATIQRESSLEHDNGTSVWLCPNVLSAYEAAWDNAPASEQDAFKYGDHVVVMGKDVNVRIAPAMTADIIGTASHEILYWDRETFNSLSPAMQRVMTPDTWDSWTPVILPNGQRGYMSTRYAFWPLGYRAVFRRLNNQWQLNSFIVGD
jgi:hypothetical protein